MLDEQVACAHTCRAIAGGAVTAAADVLRIAGERFDLCVRQLGWLVPRGCLRLCVVEVRNAPRRRHADLPAGLHNYIR
jgi:hypothetical protein